MVSGRRREEGFSPSSSQPSLVSGTLDPVGVHGQLVCGGFVRRFAVENNQETEVCGTRPSGRKKRKWKWPASRTPPVEGRTSREEAQTMRNEPGQDIEPENPGVVCVVHAPSLARMCRDEDPALDKIWVQNKKRPASVLAPWQNPPVTQRECGGGADTPPPLPTKQKDAKFYLSCFSLHWRR